MFWVTSKNFLSLKGKKLHNVITYWIPNINLCIAFVIEFFQNKFNNFFFYFLIYKLFSYVRYLHKVLELVLLQTGIRYTRECEYKSMSDMDFHLDISVCACLVLDKPVQIHLNFCSLNPKLESYQCLDFYWYIGYQCIPVPGPRHSPFFLWNGLQWRLRN